MLLYQPNEGYCYNSDSIFLYGFVSKLSPKGKMLDIGAGCGIVGLLLARDNKKILLEGVEKQSVYADFAERNAKINHIPYLMHRGDFLDLSADQEYDWIVSNPPFYHEGAAKSDDIMLHHARYSVHLPIEKLALGIKKSLKNGGHAALCYEASQFSKLCHAFESVGLRVVDVQFLYSKAERHSHLVMIHVRKNSRSLLKVWPPFITLDEDGYTSEAKAIYQQAKAHSIKCPI